MLAMPGVDVIRVELRVVFTYDEDWSFHEAVKDAETAVRYPGQVVAAEAHKVEEPEGDDE